MTATTSSQGKLPNSSAVGPNVSVSVWVMALLAFGGVAYVYRDVIAQLIDTWGGSPDDSHGFAVPLFVGWLAWLHWDVLSSGFRQRHRLPVVLGGLGLLLLALLTRAAGVSLRSFTLEAASLFPLAAGTVLLLCGWKAFKTYWPATAFLLFMLPLPGVLSGPLRGRLQEIATTLSVFTLQTLGVPTLSRGNVIVLPDTEVGVAEACSGLRMLTTFAMLVAAICILIDRGPLQKLVLMLLIVPVAVLVNAARVTVAALAAQYTPQWSEQIHDSAGWAMMILATVLLWGALQFMSALFQTDSSPRSSRSRRPATS